MKNFLRQTTTVQKQKWFLSAFLFAALGSNYYFQSTSLEKGRFDMSSEKKAVKVEGNASATACTDCDKVQLTQAEYKNLKALAAEFEALKAEKEIAKKESEKKIETVQEKRERLKVENSEKEKAKKDKETDAKLARNDEFQGRMEDAASSCEGDIECSTGKMISLLERFSGKNKVDASTVTKVFNQYIAKDLRAALKNPESAEVTLQSLQQLGLEIPSDYRFLKEKTVDIIKNDALLKGMEVNRNFRMADTLTKAKKPLEASQYLAAAFQQRDELTYSSNLIYQTTIQALQESRDSTTMDYIKRTYLPDMSKMLLNLSIVNGLDTVASGTSASTTLNQPNQATTSTRTNSRSDTDIANPLNQNTDIANQKMQNNQNLLNNVQFGNTSSQKRGTRGAVQ